MSMSQSSPVTTITLSSPSSAPITIIFLNATLAALMLIVAVAKVPTVIFGLSLPEPIPIIAIPATSAAIALAVANVSACPGNTKIISPLFAVQWPIAWSIVAHARSILSPLFAFDPVPLST